MSQSKNPSSPRSDRRQWQRIFDALVEMVRSQQSQIETLANDRTFLQQYIQIQNDRWSAKARILESHVAQFNEQEKKGRKVQAGTLNLLVGVKQREAWRYKKQLEESESDLDDFKTYVEVLLAEIKELKEKLKNSDSDKLKNGPVCSKPADTSQGNKKSTALEEKLRKLKHSYKNLSSKKELEASALLSEKDFVWNQLKKMEGDYTIILKAKRIEVEQANKTIQKLQSDLENLHSLISEKSEIIVKLEGERDRFGSDLRRCTQEAKKASHDLEKLQLLVEKLQSLVKEKDRTIEGLKSNLAIVQNVAGCSNRKSRFSTEQDSQRKQKDVINTPEGSQPRRASKKRHAESAEVSRVKKQRGANKDSSVSRVSSSSNGLRQCSSGKRTRTTSPENNSPRLFSANFKIPKLRNTPSKASPPGAS